MNQIYREKCSQSRAIYSLALRDEKNREVCLHYQEMNGTK